MIIRYAIEKLLRERLTDIRTERDLLRRDLRTGYTDATAQVIVEMPLATYDTVMKQPRCFPQFFSARSCRIVRGPSQFLVKQLS